MMISVIVYQMCTNFIHRFRKQQKSTVTLSLQGLRCFLVKTKHLRKLIKMPPVGVEPTLPQRELDFESSASANSATEA